MVPRPTRSLLNPSLTELFFAIPHQECVSKNDVKFKCRFCGLVGTKVRSLTPLMVRFASFGVWLEGFSILIWSNMFKRRNDGCMC